MKYFILILSVVSITALSWSCSKSNHKDPEPKPNQKPKHYKIDTCSTFANDIKNGKVSFAKEKLLGNWKVEKYYDLANCSVHEPPKSKWCDKATITFKSGGLISAKCVNQYQGEYSIQENGQLSILRLQGTKINHGKWEEVLFRGNGDSNALFLASKNYYIHGDTTLMIFTDKYKVKLTKLKIYNIDTCSTFANDIKSGEVSFAKEKLLGNWKVEKYYDLANCSVHKPSKDEVAYVSIDRGDDVKVHSINDYKGKYSIQKNGTLSTSNWSSTKMFETKWGKKIVGTGDGIMLSAKTYYTKGNTLMIFNDKYKVKLSKILDKTAIPYPLYEFIKGEWHWSSTYDAKKGMIKNEYEATLRITSLNSDRTINYHSYKNKKPYKSGKLKIFKPDWRYKIEPKAIPNRNSFSIDPELNKDEIHFLFNKNGSIRFLQDCIDCRDYYYTKK